MKDMAHIRLATVEDAEALLDIYRPYISMTWLTTEAEVPTPEAFRTRVADVLEKYPFVVAEVGDDLCGYAYAHRYRARPAYDWSAELSIYLDEDWSGYGLGKLLYGTVIQLLDYQHVQTVYGMIVRDNEPSAGLHLGMGFSPIATYSKVAYKRGAWLDLMLFEKDIGDHPIPPPPFLPLHKVKPEALEETLTVATKKFINELERKSARRMT
ncbi:N-acetyltransferase family protein [Peptococcus simiae]|uniref:N-acetyltransferase family protein n=1 Tax=Peptococcus simiae TaxID=1643805 RepID=A0ABW9H213_9FIRM